MKGYCQISMFNEENPIISDTQSKKTNTDNIKRAIRHLSSGLIMLNGTAYRKDNVNEFIDKAAELCDCDRVELIEYAVNYFNGLE